MRLWRFWWRTLVLTTQYNPPESIENLMVLLMLAFGLNWVVEPNAWQYPVLSSSFAIGAAISMWIREMLIPSPRPRAAIVLAVALLLIYSFFAFVNVAAYAN